jgi:hypothetical protein
MKSFLFPVLISFFAVFQAEAQIDLKQKSNGKPATPPSNTTQPLPQNRLGEGLSNDAIVNGLKETLTLSANKAASKASITDGFFKNAAIKIPFPPEAKVVENRVRSLGMGSQVDRFILTLNRAAEDASKSAAPIFVNAIKSMSITDGLNILRGSNTAATEFLKDKTTNQLQTAFQPVVKKAINNVKLTQAWNPIITRYNQIPGVTRQNPNLEAYVTQKTIEGVFYLLAEEEKQIRKDPAGTANNIIRNLFGIF